MWGPLQYPSTIVLAHIGTCRRYPDETVSAAKLSARTTVGFQSTLGIRCIELGNAHFVDCLAHRTDRGDVLVGTECIGNQNIFNFLCSELSVGRPIYVIDISQLNLLLLQTHRDVVSPKRAQS
jgi:hypothetical protein